MYVGKNYVRNTLRQLRSNVKEKSINFIKQKEREIPYKKKIILLENNKVIKMIKII